MRRSLYPLLLLAISLLLIGVGVAEAAWASIKSGYAITTNYQGQTVLIPEDVTATAGTTNYPYANKVRFRWIPPAGSGLDPWETGPFDLTPSDEYWDGNQVYVATDTQEINAVGDWGVQAFFLGEEDGKPRLRASTDIVSIRATSFEAVPEIPMGTLSALLVLLTGFAAFRWAKSRSRNLPFPIKT